jgi:hypothetical protein
LESCVERHGGLCYAVLRDRKGKLLRAYRVRHDGQLKRCERLPRGIE